MDQTAINITLLFVLAVFCYFSHNYSVTISILLLIVIKLTPLSHYLPYFNQYGLTAGIVLLTAAMMVPLINGAITSKALISSFKSLSSVIAIFLGVFVAWLGSKGTSLISENPSITISFIIGSLIGVIFFKGIPVGMIVAAGMLSLFFNKPS